jgi:hypothetical protein
MARGQMIKNPGGMPTGPILEARWDSQCAKGDTIDEGEEIVMYGEKPWHVECAEEAGLQTGRA